MAFVPLGDVPLTNKVSPTVDKLLPLHPGYSAMVLKRQFWRGSYAGGDDYPTQMDTRGEPILWQHPREDPDTFATRKKTAKCPNFCGPIMRMFNDFGFKKGPDREKEGPPEYLDLIKNADGYGMSLDHYMRKWLGKAQVEQVAFTMPINPIDDGIVINTKAEQKTAGAAPRLMIIGADQVVNWSHRGGQLFEVLLLLEIDGKPTARFLTESTRQDFKLKRAAQGDRRKDASSWMVKKAGPTIPHGYPGLPLIAMAPMPEDDCGDTAPQSQVAPIAEQQQDYLNIQSWLREELWNCVFTQFWVAGARPPAQNTAGPGGTDEAKFGTNRWFWFPNADASLNRTSAAPEAAEQLRTQLTEIKMNIYLAAGLESEDPEKSKGDVQSGIALAFKFQNLAAQLSALVDACESAENKVWHLLEDAWGFTIPKDTKYPDDFDIANFAEELAGLVQALATNGLPSVMREKLTQRFADRNLNLSDEDKELMLTQMAARSAAAEAAGSAFPPPVTTGGPKLPKTPEPPTPGK